MFLTVNADKTVLSGETAIYKTERFVRQTAAFAEIDLFLGKLGESVIADGQFAQSREQGGGGKLPCFRLRLGDAVFFAATGGAVAGVRGAGGQAGPKDLIFFKYAGGETFVRRGDRRFAERLKQKTFAAEFVPAAVAAPGADFLKLYRLTGSETVNFPLLDATQSRIVALEDQNVLVQGVAGSGKTNLCIDKIVFAAGRGYAGRILYSTFSRGLLADTKGKVLEFCAGVRRLIGDLETGAAVFCGGGRVKAVENKLGVCLSVAGEEQIVPKLKSIADYLEDKTDYCLIEDLYRQYAGEAFETADERYFVRSYVQDLKNHQLAARLSRVAYLSHEVIYKEIYGMISGCCDPENPQKTLALTEYTARRKDSFTPVECEVIWSLAQEYFRHLQKNNLTDNNRMSRALLAGGKLPRYSLAVLDEVQDMTEANLVLFKTMSLKLFCVGDALQMINASYFSFAYVKRLLYEKDISSVAELSNNYRNTKKIADVAENLGKLNARAFGVHSFVLKSKSVDAEGARSAAVYVQGRNFLDSLNRQAFNNYTVVVAGQREKERLRARLKKQEILTVAEIKGLERDTVVLCDLLSANAAQWRSFGRAAIDRKAADENSVYRYYFNLLYVGVSRARERLYVTEAEAAPAFSAFFAENFRTLPEAAALADILDTDKTEAEQDELLERVQRFIALGQYDNARFAAQKILSEPERAAELNRIDVGEKYIAKGLHRDAGIQYLRLAMYGDARRQFVLCNDETLARLAESCAGQGGGLGLEAVSAFPEVGDNEAARKVIVGLVQEDLDRMRETVKAAAAGLKKING
ncbi:MAG: hypothetical protein LBL66_04960 [Clostridiales bacterium]|jgi:superfamily I DNA/RNA helicase|nr:hypothetical protein [Clostridiales bacterium]